MDNSKKILRRLQLLHPKKIDLSLHRIKRLLKKLNNPHFRMAPVIHIAGTNGKGSVISFLRSIFEKAGLRIHTYTSPHLIRFNERIRINSKLISNRNLNLLLEECEHYNNGEEITFFEITTAAAFLAFSREDSDLVLLETGLGGKYDATNIAVNTICSVITTISMDHMNFLGSSIKKIASEKLGIFNNSKYAIISKQKMNVRNVIRAEAQKKKILILEESVNWEILQKYNKNKSFLFRYKESNYNFNFPLLHGQHQVENASTAIATALSIKNKNITEKVINKGVLSANWAGRMQKLDKGKLTRIMGKNYEIWLDGGHNTEASNILYKEIELWRDKKTFLIFGMMIGKEPIKFLKKIVNKVSSIFLLPIQDQQYIPPYELKKKIESQLKSNIDIFCILEIKEALKIIKKENNSGRILICGSLYLAAEILKEDEFKIS